MFERNIIGSSRLCSRAATATNTPGIRNYDRELSEPVYHGIEEIVAYNMSPPQRDRPLNDADERDFSSRFDPDRNSTV